MANFYTWLGHLRLGILAAAVLTAAFAFSVNAQQRQPPPWLEDYRKADALQKNGSMAEADALFRQILPQVDDMKPRAMILVRLAVTSTKIGKYDDAERYIREGLPIVVKHFGPNHLLVQFFKQQLAVVTAKRSGSSVPETSGAGGEDQFWRVETGDSLVDIRTGTSFPKQLGELNRQRHATLTPNGNEAAVRYLFSSPAGRAIASVFVLADIGESASEHFGAAQFALKRIGVLKLLQTTEPVLFNASEGPVRGFRVLYEYDPAKVKQPARSELIVFERHGIIMKIRLDYAAALSDGSVNFAELVLTGVRWPEYHCRPACEQRDN